jgi:hypothetical protein
MEYGEYEVRVAKDGRLISFVCAIHAKLFDKIILKKIMKDNYHEGSARVIAWDDTVQEMEGKKVHPKNGLYGGMPQVAYLKWKCTGTPIAINKLDYQTPYCVKMRGEWHTQCNCIVLITVQSAENHVRSELEVKKATLTCLGSTAARARTTLQPLLPNAGRGNWKRGTR